MEHLWAPWRNQYVTNQTGNHGRIFADIAQSSEDEQHFVLARGKTCFALLNCFPYNTGHLLVVPYRLVAQLEDLSDAETLEMMALIKRLKAALTAAFHPDGFNLGINLGAAAGAGIAEHLHIHLVPRWHHDANFMTTTAGTRIHPADLPSVYRSIKQKLEAPTA
jgi:ATP adenylyltransferase